ncbi:DUF1778 domain-containing protein [Actinomadura adrarensis]|uniref:DUF1778 domain-containing protein n=1 Tax=Actinomadura adrarensis TaxID=1819600 RepID=A0ABW3CJ46_9ACTN
MSESVPQDLPLIRPDDRLEIPLSPDQNLVIRKAAQLVGWTVEQYVLSATLDRAERDLFEQATLQRQTPARLVAEPTEPSDDSPGTPHPAPTVEPFISVVTALG